MQHRILNSLAAAALASAIFVVPAHAQIGRMIHHAVDNAVQTKIDNMVNCAVNDQDCIDKAHADGKEVTVVDKNGKPLKDQSAANATDQSAAGSQLDNPDATAFVNYDFVPGDSVLFAEDFAHDPVGDLPLRAKVLGGNWEVATYKGQNMLRGTGSSGFMIPLPDVLPAKFTFEMDIIQSGGWNTRVFLVPDSGDMRSTHNAVDFGYNGGIGDFNSAAGSETANTLYHARVMADGEHVKVYENGRRVANVPEAKLGRSTGIWVEGNSDEDSPTYYSNIRVAASTVSIFDGLNASGRVATHGIMFDVNSAKIRAEGRQQNRQVELVKR